MKSRRRRHPSRGPGSPDPYRSTVMTGSPPPSDRSESAKSALLALLRPVLFATTTIGLTLGILVVLHHQNSPPAPKVAAKPIVLPDPELSPPINAADFQGFQGFQSKPSQPQPPDPEP